MSKGRGTVLLIEDNRGDTRLIQELLSDTHGDLFHLECVQTLSEGLERIPRDEVTIILLDLSLPDSQGLATFARVRDQAPKTPIIILSGLEDERVAVSAVQQGAQDYLVKGHLHADLLTRAMDYAVERKRFENQIVALNQTLERRVEQRTAFLRLMQDVAVIANEATSIDGAFQAVLDRIRLQMGWQVGHACMPKRDNEKVFVDIGVWSTNLRDRFALLIEATERVEFEAGHCLIGRVIAGGKPEWVADISRQPDLVRGRQGRELGVTGALAFPVLAGKRIVAVLEFFGDQIGQPDEEFLQAMAHIGTQLGRVVERRWLQRQLIDAVWEEQRRLGQELHDGPCQQLTGLSLLAASLLKRLKAKSQREAMSRLIGVVEKTNRHIRSLAKNLFPAEVDPEMLVQALHELATGVGSLYPIKVTVESDTPFSVKSGAVATHLLRIAQEAVNNSIKHAHAAHVSVTLTDDGRSVTLDVRDDGKGIGSAKAAADTGMGMRIMQSRAHAIGGTVVVQPADGGGTLVRCRTYPRG